jgi:hypothetical protein
MFSNMNKFWKIIYFLPVIPVYLIIYTVIYTFTVYYCLDGVEFSTSKLFICLFFYFFALMTIICHTISMITNPGYVDQKLMVNKEANESSDLFCKKCNKPRPVRSHHCSTCQKCVLKMDHHCPWIFNCVGFYNQKVFYLFLFYATFGDLIACVCLLFKILDPYFFEMILRPKRRINPYADYIILEILASIKDPILIILGFCLSLAITLAVGILFGHQTYLISNNITSIENAHAKKKQDAPFYSKFKIIMLKSVLGFNPGLNWLLPKFKANKYNDGYSFYIPDEKKHD